MGGWKRNFLEQFDEVVVWWFLCLPKNTLTSVTVNQTVWFVEVMAFWHRIEKSKLKTAYFQFRRCYTNLNHASFSNSTPITRPMVMPNPYSLFHDRPTNFLNSVRFYAVPVQVNLQTFCNFDELWIRLSMWGVPFCCLFLFCVC
jgi:hypothetical protein